MTENVVTIERDLLLRMANDPKYTAILPSLKTFKTQMQPAKKSCGRCGRKQRPNRDQAMIEAAKRSIANASSVTQGKLKGLLGATAIRIKYVRADGQGTVVKRF